MGTEEVFRTNRRNISRQIPLPPQDPDFRRVAKWQPANIGTFFHIDLKTAFCQGQSYGVNRDVVYQVPPEASHPLYIAASLKKPAYGMK